ncbi:MAG: hypothetical protein ACRC10_09125 [Thermoguttaceae bacterium]
MRSHWKGGMTDCKRILLLKNREIARLGQAQFFGDKSWRNFPPLLPYNLA